MRRNILQLPHGSSLYNGTIHFFPQNGKNRNRDPAFFRRVIYVLNKEHQRVKKEYFRFKWLNASVPLRVAPITSGLQRTLYSL